MNFLRFLISKHLWLSILLVIVLLVSGYFVLDNYLKSYTRKGIEVIVPDVVNSHINDLPELLEKQGFRYELLDSIYDRNKKKGTVVEQTPQAGELVKEGRKIYITINARTSKRFKIYLDNVLKGTVRAAMDNLSSMDVQVDSIEYKDYPYDDIVLAIKNNNGKILKNNELIKAGSKLTLVVGKTGNTKVRVPNIIGKKLNEALYEVISSNLNVSVTGLKDHLCGNKIDSTKAVIKLQQPKAYEEVKTGSSISLFYTCDSLQFP